MTKHQRYKTAVKCQYACGLVNQKNALHALMFCYVKCWHGMKIPSSYSLSCKICKRFCDVYFVGIITTNCSMVLDLQKSYLSVCQSFHHVSIQNMIVYNITHDNIDGLVQERCNSIANALELHLSYTNLLIFHVILTHDVPIAREVTLKDMGITVRYQNTAKGQTTHQNIFQVSKW